MTERKETPIPSLFPIDPAVARPILSSWLDRMRAMDDDAVADAWDWMQSLNPELTQWIGLEHYTLIEKGDPSSLASAARVFMQDLTLHELFRQVADEEGIPLPRVEVRDLAVSIRASLGATKNEKSIGIPSFEGINHFISRDWAKVFEFDGFMQEFCQTMDAFLPAISEDAPFSPKSIRAQSSLSLLNVYRTLRSASERQLGRK